MSRIKHTPAVPGRNRQKVSSIDSFERICYIVDKYLRWPLQLIAIICLFIFLEAETAQKASLYVLGTGGLSSAKKLIEQIPFFNGTKD